MTIFQDSHHFSRTLGDVWWQSWKTAMTSAKLWAMFDDNLSRQPSLQQNFGQSSMTIFKDSHHFSRTLGSLWWQSFKTAITSAELWAVFDNNVWWQRFFWKNPSRPLSGKMKENIKDKDINFLKRTWRKSKERCAMRPMWDMCWLQRQNPWCCCSAADGLGESGIHTILKTAKMKHAHYVSEYQPLRWVADICSGPRQRWWSMNFLKSARIHLDKKSTTVDDS